MKTFTSFFRERPWLMVVLAFVILISAWTTIISLSGRVPSKRLSADEEAAILERGTPP